MLIRTATNDDAAAVRTLLFEVLAEYGLLAEHEGVDADLTDLEGNYLKRGGLFDLVFEGTPAPASDDGTPPNKLIGMVGLYPRESKVAELRKMYLRKSARGRGIGKQLLERVLARARELGFRRIELETSSKLIEAIGLYRKYGFQPLGLDQLACRCDQAFFLNL